MTRKKQVIEKPVLAYTVPELASSIGKSETTVRDHIKLGNLVASYPDSEAIILAEEATRWLRTLPQERPARRAS